MLSEVIFQFLSFLSVNIFSQIYFFSALPLLASFDFAQVEQNKKREK